MIDAITYVERFDELVSYLDEHHSQLLKRGDDGNMTTPPTVVGFSRTPAVTQDNELMAYMRLSQDQADYWRKTPGVTILAEAEFTGKGTGQRVYDQVFNDPDKYEIYSRVYPHESREVDDGEGGTMTVAPPKKFGIIAGA